MSDQGTDRGMLECAKINFENLEKAMPILKEHPYYIIAKSQLDEGLGYEVKDLIPEDWKK